MHNWLRRNVKREDNMLFHISGDNGPYINGSRGTCQFNLLNEFSVVHSLVSWCFCFTINFNSVFYRNLCISWMWCRVGNYTIKHIYIWMVVPLRKVICITNSGCIDLWWSNKWGDWKTALVPHSHHDCRIILIAVKCDFEPLINGWYKWWLSSEGAWLYGGWHNVFNGLAFGLTHIFCKDRLVGCIFF